MSITLTLTPSPSPSPSHPHPHPRPHQVTRQYRKLARKWHPDRYKGLKVRAERKMRECSEAKEVLVKQMGC